MNLRPVSSIRGILIAVRNCCTPLPRGPVSLRTLYFEPDMCYALPNCCSVIEISALLRELIVAVTKFDAEYNMPGREDRIMQLIIEGIASTPGIHRPPSVAPFSASLNQYLAGRLDETTIASKLTRRPQNRR
jgi:hypothetical protein